MAVPIDTLALGREIGALSATLRANMETQAQWRDSVKSMLVERMDAMEADMREFKAEIRGDMKRLEENTETGIQSLQAAISGFRSKITIGKTVAISVSIAAGAMLVLVALGFQEWLAWMGKIVMKWFD